MDKLSSQFWFAFTRRPWFLLVGFLFLGLMLGLRIQSSSAGPLPVAQVDVEQKPGASLVIDQGLAAAGVISQLRNDDGQPAVEFSGAGYLVVWQDINPSESDPETGIYGRLLNTVGAHLSSTFPISEGSYDYERRNPDVAYHTVPGNYMVVWEQDTNDVDIFAQRVQQDGALMGGEIPIAGAPEAEQHPAIAANGGDPVEYLVVYQRYNGGDYDIYGQRLDMTGAPTGPEILVAEGDADQVDPDAAFDLNTGRYRVAWQERAAGAEQSDIYSRLIAKDGSYIGGPLAVSSHSDHQANPHIAADPSHSRFLVVWEQHTSSGTVSYILAQLVTADGPLTGPVISVAEGGAVKRLNPAVAFHNEAQAFMVTWETALSDANHNLYRRRLRPDGTLAEKEIQVTSLAGLEGYPALAPDHDLSFMLAWEDDRDTAASAGTEVYGELVRINQLSGAVYAGEKGDLSTPIAGVTVSLGCSAYPDAIGNTVETDVTDVDGWFRLNAPAGCAYYNLLETDPVGYLSNGAAALDATVRDPNWIQYLPPLEGKIQHANQFFDRSAPVISVLFEEQTAGTYLDNHYSNKQLIFVSDYQANLGYQESPQVQSVAGAHTASHVAVNTFSDNDLFSSRDAPMSFWFLQPMSVINFQLGTQSVGSTACTGTSAAVKAYDCSGNLVFSQNYTGVSPAFTTSVNMTDPQGRIQRVVVDYGGSPCPEAIDTLTFQSGAAACSDLTPPVVQIIAPAKNSTFNSAAQTIVGQVEEPGIVRFAALNGSILPLKLTDPAGVYRFSTPVSMSNGVNTYTAGAVNYSFGIGTDNASYTVGTVASVALSEFHLTQRGVIKAGACDIDSPFVAGKSGLVRIKLNVKTAKGDPAYVTSVDMKLMRLTTAGFQTVKTISGVVYPQLYDSFFDPNQMQKIVFPFSGADVAAGGVYRFVFQPYVKALPYGQPLEMKCGTNGSGMYTFDETEHVRVLILPVEVPINSPLLAGTNNVEDLMTQLAIAARVMPVRDFGGATSGVDWEVLAPFLLCDGSQAMTKSNKICGGIDFEWNFIDHDPSGMLRRADDEAVIDLTRTFCNKDDHIFGGRIRSNLTFTYNFTPALGIFRPGAHMNWYGAKHATPTDVDHNGVIDAGDLTLYIETTFNPLQSAWQTYPNNTYVQGDTFRFFADENNNNCNDWDDEDQAPIRIKFDNMNVILFEPEKQALSTWNAIETDDFDSALLAFPKLMMPPPAFNAIGLGSSHPSDHTVWLQVRADDTMAHELGHSVADLKDLYEGHDNWAPDDLGAKENAIAVYVDGQELAPISTTVVMAGGANVVHYQPDYKTLFNKLKLGSKDAAEDALAGPVFQLSARFMPGGSVKVLSTRVSQGLEVTSQDPSGPYALVFGAGTTVLAQHRFSIADPSPMDPSGAVWPAVLFHAAAPLPGGTTWVELRKDGQALARMTPSVHAPTVQVISPSGGETYTPQAVIPVTWRASDEDGDELTFDLFYSPDGGATWGLVAAGVGGTSFAWPAAAAPGSSEGWLRVVASDGFNSGQDESANSFTIEGHDPVASVTSPAAGQAFLACGSIPLRGAFYDLEGPLETASWSLDGEPAGSTLELDLPPLPPGEHEATLTVLDQDGNPDTHNIAFTVTADVDCDGMSDDYEDAHDLDKMNYNDATQDPDRDGLPNIDEYRYGTDPFKSDTDGDGFSDGREVQAHTDPTDADSYPHYMIWMPVVRK